MENIGSYIYYLKRRGFMDEYSSAHFINKLFRGEVDFFRRYFYLRKNMLMTSEEINLSSTFLMNFSNNLENLTRKFSNHDIEDFVKHQLAAGKANYSEEQFFSALSEINVLVFLSNFVHGFIKGKYEPRLNDESDSNPEARLEYNNGVTIDVEVKTPGFISTEPLKKPFLAKIKPNIILSREGLTKVRNYCQDRNINLVLPRVLKLKDFIESAAKKFDYPVSDKHYNLLFINWTYTDFPECELSEPLSLLANPISGILSNPNAAEMIGLQRTDLEKISAIIVYRDSFDTLLSGNFMYHYGHKSFSFLVNDVYNQKSDVNLLGRILHMNPFNNTATINWQPIDWEIREDNKYDELLIETSKFIYDTMWDSDELLSGLCCDIQSLRKYKDKITKIGDINHIKKYVLPVKA